MDTIALGVDGMEPKLVDKWVSEGKLPNIQSLRENGTFGTARCSSLVSAQQWVTHFTGIDAAQHGVTGFLKSDEMEHRLDEDPKSKTSVNARKLINLDNIKHTTYPELLSESGHDVGLINPLPIWPPLELEDGFCISGMITPPTADHYTYPPSLAGQLDEFGYRIDIQYGDRPMGFIDDKLLRNDETTIAKLREDIYDVLDHRIRYTRQTIKNDEVGYLFSLLKSIDLIQHVFWAHMEDGDNQFSDTILECYQKIDELVGWVRESHPDIDLIMFSDLGFGPRKDPTVGSLHSIGYLLNTYVHIPYRIRRIYERFLKTEPDIDVNDLDQISGDHSNPAVWMMAGPSVRSRGRIDVAFEDIPPTILAMLNHPIPNAYIGAPITDALTVKHTTTNTSLAVNRETQVHVSEEVSDRLYNLGYADMVEDN